MEFPKNFVCATADRSTYSHHVPAPMFRKAFVLHNAPASAQLRICGLGFYRLFVNGQEITRSLLAPYISNPDHALYYDDYDLTAHLTAGENVIGVLLGNGMGNPMITSWDCMNAPFSDAPKMAVCAEIADGDTVRTLEGKDFCWALSPILFDNYRFGEHYDARLEQPGWSAPGFDDSAWRQVMTASRPRGTMRICEAEPVKVMEERTPVSVKKGEMVPVRKGTDDYRKLMDTIGSDVLPEQDTDYTGGYIYDFGLNGAGVYRLNICAESGQRITVQAFEKLDEQGRADIQDIGGGFPEGYFQRDVYYCKGGAQLYQPSFVYHGFRYLYVTGITEAQATEDLLTALVIHNDVRRLGAFDCSDEMANTIWAMAERSDLSNMVWIPTDCPQREKNGWTGDISMSAEHQMLEFDTQNVWREWLHNVRAAQNEAGALPGIVPTAGWGYQWGNGPAWDSALFNLPYICWKYRGNTQLIRENGHAMMSYLDYISRRRNRRGLIDIGLGDWVPVVLPDCYDRFVMEFEVPRSFTDSVMVMDMCRKGAAMFGEMGWTLQRRFAEELGREVREAVRRELVDLNQMTVLGDSQSGQAMGLYYGVFEPGERQEAFRQLMHRIRRDGNRFSVGFLGLRVLFHVLSDFGESELAYDMITRTEYPSYGHLVQQGCTTLTENFRTSGGVMQSLNHHFYGDVNHWFVRQVVGLHVNPYDRSCNEVLIHPHFVEKVDHASFTYELPKGKISVAWARQDDGTIRLEVHAAPGIVGQIRLDDNWRCTPHWYSYDILKPDTVLTIRKGYR